MLLLQSPYIQPIQEWERSLGADPIAVLMDGLLAANAKGYKHIVIGDIIICIGVMHQEVPGVGTVYAVPPHMQQLATACAYEGVLMRVETSVSIWLWVILSTDGDWVQMQLSLSLSFRRPCSVQVTTCCCCCNSWSKQPPQEGTIHLHK